MKKLLIALTLFLTVQLGAQTKEAADALKSYEKAKKEVENPKKATNTASWLKLSAAYTAVFDAPIKSLWLGASQVELKVLLKDQRITSTEARTVNGQEFSVDSYYDKDLYYAKDGTLASWVITKPYLEGDLLKLSFDALMKAEEFDAKGSKTKDITEALNALRGKYVNEAMAAYALGKFKEATDNFEASLKCSSHKFVGMVDTTIMYYAGLTANMSQDYERAAKYFEMCISNNYELNGDVYSYLAEAYKAMKDIDKAKEVLGAGFTKFPTSQSVLVSLINAYLESNDDPKKVLEYIQKAQQNEPGNASLYYAEGNVWKKLNEIEKAVACYQKSIEVDPNYYFGSFAIGAAYYDNAVELQTKASEELDDAKYEALVKQLEQQLEAAIEPFEKCYATTNDQEVKSVVAEYLKNIYFRFREKSEAYKAGYEKYNAIVEKNTAK